jgi:hypothetical protein
MSDEYPRLTLSLLGTMAARLSLVVLLSYTFMISWAALGEANPSAAAEVTETITVVTVAGVGIDFLSPFMMVLIAWSIAPLVELYAHRARIDDDLTAEDTA